MRAFNKREKEIIKELVAIRSNYNSDMMDFINRIIYPLKKSEGLYFDLENKNLYLLLPVENDLVDNRVKEAVYDFYEFLSLIIYLAENRWITVFNSPKPPNFDDDHYLVLGEIFEKDDNGKAIHGFRASSPPECPNENYDVPYASKDGQKTHQSWELGDSLYSISVKYFLNDIFVSEDLKELVRNNFVTHEEKQYKNQLVVSWCAIGVAIVIAILNYLFR